MTARDTFIKALKSRGLKDGEEWVVDSNIRTLLREVAGELREWDSAHGPFTARQAADEIERACGDD